MAAVIGQDIGLQIIKALGLQNQRVRSIDFHIARDEPVIAKVERLVMDEEAQRLISVVSEYRLVPKEEEQPNGCPANK